MITRRDTPPEVSVIILNWNGERLLPACLSALAAQTFRDFELWLVDNGSIDGSAALLDDLERSLQPAWIESPLPRLAHIVRNTSNVGFAAGNNQAIRQARGRYIVALNNDAIPEPGWLAEMVLAARQSDPSVGMVASTMLFAHKPTVVASAGISMHRDGVALDRAVGMESAQLECRGTRPVFGPSAGAALYMASMLRDVGLFDERFFSYLEDADLAWRARARGWRAVHTPHARVYHEYSATGVHGSPLKRSLLSRNRVWTLYKNMPSTLFRRYLPLIVRYEALAVLNGIATRDKYLVRGRFEGLARLDELAADRRRIAASARVVPEQMADWLSPALSPRQALKYRKRLDALLASRPPLF